MSNAIAMVDYSDGELFHITHARSLRSRRVPMFECDNKSRKYAIRFIVKTILHDASSRIFRANIEDIARNGFESNAMIAVLFTAAINYEKISPEHKTHVVVRNGECAFTTMSTNDVRDSQFECFALDQLLVWDNDVREYLNSIFNPYGYSIAERINGPLLEICATII